MKFRIWPNELAGGSVRKLPTNYRNTRSSKFLGRQGHGSAAKVAAGSMAGVISKIVYFDLTR